MQECDYIEELSSDEEGSCLQIPTPEIVTRSPFIIWVDDGPLTSHDISVKTWNPLNPHAAEFISMYFNYSQIRVCPACDWTPTIRFRSCYWGHTGHSGFRGYWDWTFPWSYCHWSPRGDFTWGRVRIPVTQ